MGLRDGEEELDAVLVQPKRFGLLAYIALRRPGDFVRRDELLGAFWAESTEARARAALRQALRFLRRHLGRDVVVNRGDSGVGIGPDALACDALEFLAALDGEDDEAAVDRYGGDLLPGLVVEGAWEFDRWLHAERQRLRVAAVGAALRLADAAEASGDVAGAAERVRWAHRLEPLDEAVARRLISLLTRSGNRAAAVAAFDALVERLQHELDLEPSPATVRLFETIRRPGGADAAAGWLGAHPPALSPQRVLVQVPENLTGDGSLDAVGRLAADTVARGLATIADLEVVPPVTVQSDASVLDVARRTGAGTVLTGTVHEEGDALLFQVRILDVQEERLLPAPEPVRADRHAPLEGMERLRERVMTMLGPALSRRVVHVRRASRPPGMEAYRAYLDGLDRFIRRDWQGALVLFRRSAELEPEYALPRIVCSITLWNLGKLEEALATARVADGLRNTLGAFEHAVLDMVLAWLAGDWATARRAALRQAEVAPGSIPHFQVAEEARRLNRPREAREVLGRLDPEAGELRGWIFYWLELATAHHLVGDHRRELEVASRCRSLHPDDPAAALMEIRALAGLGREVEVERAADQVLARPPAGPPTAGDLMVEAALELRAHGAGDGAEALLERAVAWYREQVGSDAPERLRRTMARTLYHAGELDEARRIFRDLVPGSGGRVHSIGFHHGHLQAHLDEGYLAVIATRERDPDEAAHWCEVLESLEAPFLYGAQWFWLAAVAALDGDHEQAARKLRRAFADGLPMEMFVHADPHLATLRGHAPFDRLLRPSG